MPNKRCITLLLLLTMLFTLVSCGNTVDMPMEVTIDGLTIVLGQTTMQDMQDAGYKASLSAVPDTARQGDKYISFDYLLSKTAELQFSVRVTVPWSGNTSINKEKSLSETEGIIRTITIRPASVKNFEVIYNGVELQDLTYEYSEKEWGAEKGEQYSKPVYKIEAKNGDVILSSENSFRTDFYSLTVQLSKKAFEKMQKK